MKAKDGLAVDATVDSIVQALATFGLEMPPDLVSRALDVGGPLEKRLIALIDDESIWSVDKQDPRYFVPMHAVVILGHMTSVQAGRALARALQSASKHWSRALDSLNEHWPKLMCNKPPEVLPSFERLMRSQRQNCYCRMNAAHVLLVAARRQDESVRNQLFSYFKLVLEDEMEDLIFRHRLARILTSLPNPPAELVRLMKWFISPLNPRMEVLSVQ